MAGKCVLVLGGARSGKSSLAQEMARGLGQKVLFVATGAALDVEMASRIEEHKRARPKEWRTLEAVTDVGERISAKVGDAEVVLIDCVTLLVSNVLFASGPAHAADEDEQIDEDSARVAVSHEIEGIVNCIENTEATFIVVSNEVGLGLVPIHQTGRVYRDLLGMANQVLAKRADSVYLMVAGIPWRLKGED